MALIPGIIPQQNFETIRNQIAFVLAQELASQYARNNTIPQVQKVEIERFIPINEETESPLVNVSCDMGSYDNGNMVKWDGTYMFNIDAYTTANSTADDAGDKLAMVSLGRLVGLIRAILCNPIYKTLGLDAGTIADAKVERFFITDKSTVKDALSGVVGRVQYSLRCVETIDTVNIITGVPLQDSTVTVTLNEDKTIGYFYDLVTTAP